LQRFEIFDCYKVVCGIALVYRTEDGLNGFCFAPGNGQFLILVRIGYPFYRFSLTFGFEDLRLFRSFGFEDRR
jgi:hypothetical protein